MSIDRSESRSDRFEFEANTYTDRGFSERLVIWPLAIIAIIDCFILLEPWSAPFWLALFLVLLVTLVFRAPSEHIRIEVGPRLVIDGGRVPYTNARIVEIRYAIGRITLAPPVLYLRAHGRVYAIATRSRAPVVVRLPWDISVLRPTEYDGLRNLLEHHTGPIKRLAF